MSIRSQAKQNQRMANADDAFAKRANEAQAKLGAKDPKLANKYCYLNAEMVNNGEHAQAFARTLTKGLDKKAFPVD